MRLAEEYLDAIYEEFEETLEKEGKGLPAVSEIAYDTTDPFLVLISTILSLRTRDDMTLLASKTLFERADTPEKIDALETEEIERLISKSGFYKRKAIQIKKISRILIDKYQSRVPSTMEDLMALPGVGLKTASLVLNLGFNIDAICVDCHVHQISNRLGWVKTKSPEETEKELRKILPKRFWISLNELLVRYGQHICVPISPWCSKCKEEIRCPKVGVKKTR